MESYANITIETRHQVCIHNRPFRVGKQDDKTQFELMYDLCVQVVMYDLCVQVVMYDLCVQVVSEVHFRPIRQEESEMLPGERSD